MAQLKDTNITGTLTADHIIASDLVIDGGLNATFSQKIGTAASHPSIGSSSVPVYVDSDGIIQECNPTVIGSVTLAGDTLTFGGQKGQSSDPLRDLYANSFTASSSREVKKNIVPADDVKAIDLINTIDVVHFVYKEDDKEIPHIGFIAEDTDPILSSPDQKHMDINNCIGVLIKAVQELSAENKILKERLAFLEENK